MEGLSKASAMSDKPSGNEATTNIIILGNNACLLELPAELTDADESQLFNACAPKANQKNWYVILDFDSVETINGLGATKLITFTVLSRRRGQRLLAIGVGEHYKDVLKSTGLDRIITICNNRGEAFALAQVPESEIPLREIKQGSVRDIAYWAKPVSKLIVPLMPPEAININVKGRRIVGPVDGFGQLWLKTYQLTINRPGLTPESVIRTLKDNLPVFQPSYNRFYLTAKGILPGEVVAIDSSTPGGPVSTGVMVLYADDKSFTFITPQGHPESGWVTFSAFEKNGKLVAQIVGLARASDPVYEAAFRILGAKLQVKIWTHVLSALATYLGIQVDVVVVEPRRLDPRLHWSHVGNVWYNAQIRTLFYMPFRWVRKLLK